MARAGRINHADLSLAIRGWISQPPPPALGNASCSVKLNRMLSQTSVVEA
jgi:hypothetical protein